jgi:hypothetical protein
MAENQQGRLLKKVLSNFRVAVAFIGIFLGGLLTYIAFEVFQGVWQTSVAAIGSALLGAGFLALYDALTFTNEIKKIFRENSLKEALREAFNRADNLRQDGIRLGIVRILASISEVRQQPIEELIGNAKEVYILGTTVFTTAIISPFLESKPNTQFRFILASLPEQKGNLLEKALSIIHNISIRGQLEDAKRKLEIRKSNSSNVDYKTIQFVPTFSAILAIGESEDGEPWGRLQVDHYLLLTAPDSRLWLVIEGPGTVLFDRYRDRIKDIWDNPKKYDVRTTNIL